MLRALHRWPGLLAAVLVLAIALSGTALSIFPMVEVISSPAAVTGQTVADLAAKVLETHPTVEQIRRAPSGRITAYWFDGNTPGSAVIDPVTGQNAGNADPLRLKTWLTNFHRALLLEDTGRMATAAGALAMLVLAASGCTLIASRQGGWRKWFTPMRGPLAGRWHGELARLAVAMLSLSSLTALWMTAATFDFLPTDEASPTFPAQVSGQTGLSPDAMPALAAIPVAELRDLTFPYAGDATDAFAVTTSNGSGFVDQGTGELMAWQTNGLWAQTGEWVYLLHTGEGAALWGALIGLLTLVVPALVVTGTLVWLRNRQTPPTLAGMTRADKAETVILVASEGGSTWGFAKALGTALQAAGCSVHLAPLSAFAPASYGQAKRIVIMAATWGDGDAPAQARNALALIETTKPHRTANLCVLGFGDRSFPAFCAFAENLDASGRRAGWQMLLPLERIDRQSAQSFTRWSKAFGQAISIPISVQHQPEQPHTTAITLTNRREYGQAVQAPTTILRFALPRATLVQRMTGRGFARFHAGDLIGILPQGSEVPRYYSLASGTADNFIEIVVRKHPGGLCSGQLLDLRRGQSVAAFVKPNPGFRPDRTDAPLILVGAGTGIGPLAGFIRANARRRPIHLWFGARHPQADFIYAEDFSEWTAKGQLTSLSTAFSRTASRQHVQDRLRADADRICDLVSKGAGVMVCGGRDMAQGVHETLTEILAPVGFSLAGLKAGGRYAEDSY